MSSKNILIVCWDFPPNNGIGGRRWAKIVKQLVKNGYEVDVICRSYEAYQPVSPWLKDIIEPETKVHFLKPRLLSKWISSSSTLKVRLATLILKLMCAGTIYDKAVGIQSSFLKLASELIKQKRIQNIFVTGAPFNLMYYTVLLKASFPDLKILCDYRDPWITAENYGMKQLTASRMNFEIMKQNKVIQISDVITCPNEYLLEEIKASYSGEALSFEKFEVLPHFYDIEDKKEYANLELDDTIKFVYAGTIYIGSDQYLQRLNEMITHYKNSGGKKKFKFDFYVNELEKYSIFDNNRDVVSFNKPIGNSIFNEIVNSSYVIILLSEHNKNYLTSKFFEYLPYKRPYFYIGPQGHVSNTITNQKLGIVASDLAAVLESEILPIETKHIEKYELANVVTDFLNKLDRIGFS